MSIAVLAGVILLGGAFLFFVIPEPPDPGLQTAIFVILMLIAGTIFTSTVFSDFGDKKKAMAALTLPATAFEKFLVGWLYSYLIFLLIYTAVFYLGLIGLANAKHWEPNQHFVLFSIQQRGFYTVLTIYSLLHAIALFGAIFFNKLHFIKTGFAFFIGYVVLMIFNTVFLKAIIGLDVIKAAMPFGFLNFNVGDKYYSIVTKAIPPQAILTVLCISAVLIWVAAYFRLREKQV
ncbi:hypothetical protein [Mucilaginibacter sp. BT774]|uniref:hypothetical protein n=1 Tax=Mucilaginibacter sp. BT774 TaxID=3062276 RepID=UPI0026750B52|nr:hypothetical protein [Mucilaginibacter sp. BT774]MDO3626712.1 hypothetical protein [Mucilaginibacter sp. BT774]